MEECDLQYASGLIVFVVVLRVVGLGSIWSILSLWVCFELRKKRT